MSLDYIDTSILVAALAEETHSTRAERWLTSGRRGELAISEWVIAEFSSALSIKLRIGGIDTGARTAALEAFAIMTTQSLTILPVIGAHFRIAARFADQYRFGLRAADALHLAIAGEQGATLCTLDKRLAAAGKALGLAVKLI